MLVLTRKTNQSIMIGDEIEVSILSVAGDKVRIGIDAPRDIAVFRKEVYVAIEQGAAGSAQGGRPAADGAVPASDDAQPSVDSELGKLG